MDGNRYTDFVLRDINGFEYIVRVCVTCAAMLLEPNVDQLRAHTNTHTVYIRR